MGVALIAYPFLDLRYDEGDSPFTILNCLLKFDRLLNPDM